MAPLLRWAVTLEAYGLDELAEAGRSVVFAANHSSHLDTPVLLTTLPASRRRTTVVAVAPGYFSSWWRAAGAAVAFSSTVRRRAEAVLRRGGSVVIYPEQTRSDDGYLASFGPAAAEAALAAGVGVVPVAVRGTYAAMPRGRSWPLRGRTRVSVRYGRELVPGSTETVAGFTQRIEARVRDLLAEDTHTWWAIRSGLPLVAEPPAGSWRRVWEQTQPPASGGRPPRVRVWRD